jgi:hypothetical protein
LGTTGPPIDGEDATGTGATFTAGGVTTRLAYGVRPPFPRASTSSSRIVTVGNPFAGVAVDHLFIGGAPYAVPNSTVAESEETPFDVPAAAMSDRADGRTHAYTELLFDAASGAARTQAVAIEARAAGSSPNIIVRGQVEGRHAAIRPTDGTVLFAHLSGGGSIFEKLASINLPTQPAVVNLPTCGLSCQPGDVNLSETRSLQTMPAWSPDGVKFAFVRRRGLDEANPTLRLLVFDTTPGIQAIVNSQGIDLLPEPPTPQLRAFQLVWGNVSVALQETNTATQVTCDRICFARIGTGRVRPTGPVQLRPATTGSSLPNAKCQQANLNCQQGATGVGIFVVRVTGTRRLLGRRVPRIRPVGRVPLGQAIQGRNRFRWNGRVNGRRLRPGQYLITFRVLTPDDWVQALSKSIRVRVTKSGRVIPLRIQR